MSAYAEKTRESRLRRALYRDGYRLEKSRGPRGVNAGGYMIFDSRTNFVVAGQDGPLLYVLDLDGVEDWLKTPADQVGGAP